MAKSTHLFAQKDSLYLLEKNKKSFDNYFFEAEKQKIMGKYDAQFDALKMCLQIDSLNATVNSEIGTLYAQKGMFDKAEKCFLYAAQKYPVNWWYRIQYINFLIKKKKYNKAILETEKAKIIFNQKEEIYTILASLYEQAKQYDKAIKVLNELEIYTNVNEVLSFQKFKYYLLLGKERKGIKEIKKLIKEYPNEPRYATLLGDIYLDLNKNEKAYNIYQKVLKKNPENPYAYVSMAEYFKKENKPNETINSVIKALKNPKLPSDIKMEVLGKYIDILIEEDRRKNEIETLFKMLIDMYPLEEMTYAYYSVFLQKQKRNDEALKTLESLLHINPQNITAWKVSLKIVTLKNDTVALKKLTQKAIEASVKLPEFYFYHSIRLIQEKRYKEALENNQFALKNIGEDANIIIKSALYGQIGDIYYLLNKKEKSFENYEKALIENPLNITVMNNYAYYLSLEKKDLVKAERLSAKAVELEPMNSTYLDTYAWILYEKKSYFLAKFYIEKAIENSPVGKVSAVIYEHSGDIYLANGEKEKAIKMWKKALEVDINNKKIKQKIEQLNK